MNVTKLFKRQNKFGKKLRQDIGYWEKVLTEKRRYNKQSIELLLDIEAFVLASVQMKDLNKVEKLSDHLPSSIPRIFKLPSDQKDFEEILRETEYDCTKL
ncbi:MAG: hypothetical protein KDH96_05195 [Candidatus Riesia sp.]|nr:hypothetical protein [Candidatus Riesia sp.]